MPTSMTPPRETLTTFGQLLSKIDDDTLDKFKRMTSDEFVDYGLSHMKKLVKNLTPENKKKLVARCEKLYDYIKNISSVEVS